MLKAKKISFWCFMSHIGEDDEAGKKDHIHIYAQPDCTIDTGDIKDEFNEPDLTDLKKPPLKTLIWRNSKTDDALLYYLHDKSYLAYKGESRKYHYKYEDFETSDRDELNYLYKSIDISKITPYRKMLDAQEVGMNFADYIKKGFVPIQQLKNYQTAWYLLKQESVYRDNRKGNDNMFVDENGIVKTIN